MKEEKKMLIRRYLAGEAPLHPGRLMLPTDEELNETEIVFDQLMASAKAGFAQRKKQGKNNVPVLVILRIAAMFIGVLLLSGISFAAYRWIVGRNFESPTQEMRMSSSHQRASSHQQEISESNTVRTFENVELQQILQELSGYYHVGVEFHNDEARHIRLYTKWDTSAPLQQIIERLNTFEKVNIRITDNLIISE